VPIEGLTHFPIFLERGPLGRSAAGTTALQGGDSHLEWRNQFRHAAEGHNGFRTLSASFIKAKAQGVFGLVGSAGDNLERMARIRSRS
jgi:hypothetical protein